MDQIIFRNARISYVDLRYSEDAGAFVRVHFTADFSDTVREAMSWGALEDGYKSAKLTGELTGDHMILTPNGLAQHEIQLGIKDVTAFEVARIKDGEHAMVTELKFVVRTGVAGSAGVIEDYIRTVAAADAQLRIAYLAHTNGVDERQQPLPFSGEPADGAVDGEPAAAADDGPNCVDCQNQVPFLDGDLSMHASGQPCQAYAGRDDGAAPLAPAAVMGGTHAKGRKRRAMRNPEREAFADGSGEDGEGGNADQ